MIIFFKFSSSKIKRKLINFSLQTEIKNKKKIHKKFEENCKCSCNMCVNTLLSMFYHSRVVILKEIFYFVQ